MVELLEEYRKWRDELSNHLKKLRDILTIGGVPSDDVDDLTSNFLEAITSVIADFSSELRTYIEEREAPEEGEEEEESF